MEKYLRPEEPDMISCTTCMKEIPKSAAKSVEAAGYTVHFCGLECYRLWHRQVQKSRPATYDEAAAR